MVIISKYIQILNKYDIHLKPTDVLKLVNKRKPAPSMHCLTLGCKDGEYRNLRGHLGKDAGLRARSMVWILFFFFFFFVPSFFYICTCKHMEVPRLGVESELQLPAYTSATATEHQI